MKGKWGSLILLIILVGFSFAEWQKQSNFKVMGNILSTIPSIDSVVVKDGKTKEEMLTFTSIEPSFFEMVNIYASSRYYNLKWSKRKLLKGKPLIEVEYLENNEIQYILSIYEVPNDHISLLPSDISTGVTSYSYSHSPDGTNTTYVFAIKEIYQLVGVNEGLKQLIEVFLLNLVEKQDF